MPQNDMNALPPARLFKKGIARIEKSLDRHLDRVLDVRKSVPVKNSSLISDELTKHIPPLWWHVKRKVANLRKELKEILLEIATEHEKQRFEPLREEFERLNGVSKLHLQRGSKILDTERDMFISYHALFFACKICAEVNMAMLSRIETERTAGKKETVELDLLLKNAVIVYEVTSLIVDMIRNFAVKGRQEFQSLKETVFRELAEAEANSSRNVSQALHPSIPFHQKEDTQRRDENLKESAKLVRLQWQRFEEQISNMEQNAGNLAQQLASLELTRNNAKVQLDFLELVAVTQMMNQNIHAIGCLANLELPLAPLSPFDVCRLIGLETAALAMAHAQPQVETP